MAASSTRKNSARKASEIQSDVEDEVDSATSTEGHRDGTIRSEILDSDEDIFTQARTQLEAGIMENDETTQFNPHPEERQVRRLRHGYMGLLERMRSDKKDLIAPESTRLSEMLSNANNLLSMVHTTADATLDSRFMAISADLSAEKISKLAEGSLPYSVDDFMRLLKTALRTQHEDDGVYVSLDDDEDQLPVKLETDRGDNWAHVGSIAMRHWRGVHITDFLNGPLELPPRERRNRAPGQRQGEVGPAIEPRLVIAQHLILNS